MILHLLFDDKFSDYAIDQFEGLAPGQNEYLVLRWDDEKDCRNIKNKSKVKIIREKSSELEEFCHTLDRFKAIITHNLSTPSQEKIILAAPENVKVAWVFWGFEIYSRNVNYKSFLGPLSRKRANNYSNRAKLKSIYRFIKTGKISSKVFNVSIDTFKNIDFCLTDLREDHQFAKDYIKADFKHLWYNYYSIDETLGELKNGKVNGNNILIGNSATLSNNHLEVFNLLKKVPLEDRKLIVPLSYGDKKYAHLIENNGKKLFGDHFTALTTFIERSQYNSLLQSCSVVIMNHYRHQAMGNLITAMWLGAKVFMSECSTTFSYFKRLGLHVLSIEKDLKPERKGILDPLSGEQAERNKEILLAEYGKETMHVRIAELINTLTN